MPIETEKYTYQTFYSEKDQEFVGIALEFPSLSWLADDRKEAVEGIVRLVAEVITDMVNAGEEVPVPTGERQYSGKLSLRLTPEQHRRVAFQAAEQKVSVNRYITSRL